MTLEVSQQQPSKLIVVGCFICTIETLAAMAALGIEQLTITIKSSFLDKDSRSSGWMIDKLEESISGLGMGSERSPKSNAEWFC